MKTLKRYRVKTRKLPMGERVILKLWGHSRQEILNRFDDNYKGWSYSMPRLRDVTVDHLW